MKNKRNRTHILAVLLSAVLIFSCADLSVTSAQAAGKQKNIKNTIQNVKVTSPHTLEVSLAKAKTLKKSDFTLYSKVYSSGSYREQLKVDAIKTSDKKKYTISVRSPIEKYRIVKVKIKNLNPKQTASKEILADTGSFKRTMTEILSGTAGKKVNWKADIPGSDSYFYINGALYGNISYQ